MGVPVLGIGGAAVVLQQTRYRREVPAAIWLTCCPTGGLHGLRADWLWVSLSWALVVLLLWLPKLTLQQTKYRRCLPAGYWFTSFPTGSSHELSGDWYSCPGHRWCWCCCGLPIRSCSKPSFVEMFLQVFGSPAALQQLAWTQQSWLGRRVTSVVAVANHGGSTAALSCTCW